MLGDLLEARGELLALEVDGADEHYPFNITRLVDALDQQRSEIKRFKTDGTILRVKRYEFDPERLAGETVFKLRPDRRGYEYVTDELRTRAQSAGLTGFRWEEPVWSAPIPARG